MQVLCVQGVCSVKLQGQVMSNFERKGSTPVIWRHPPPNIDFVVGCEHIVASYLEAGSCGAVGRAASDADAGSGPEAAGQLQEPGQQLHGWPLLRQLYWLGAACA